MTIDIITLVRESRARVLAQLTRLSRPSAPGGAACTVSRIDDPEGSSTIIAVRGAVDAAGIMTLWATAERLDHATTVHLDLVNATIPLGPWMAELEALGNALEAAGLAVRIVGIDPAHPDLRPRSFDRPV
jgi:hypothetical protein